MTQLPPLDRQALIAQAHAIADILDRRAYDGPDGRVPLQAELARLTAGTRHYRAEETQALAALSPTQQTA